MGGTGSCGHPITSRGYSELSTNPNGPLDFSALGNLPCWTRLKIVNPANGRVAWADKQDVGAGSSFLPVMGLYPKTREDLGLSGGEFDVIIERADQQSLRPVRGERVDNIIDPSSTSASTGHSDNPGGHSVANVAVATLLRPASMWTYAQVRPIPFHIGNPSLHWTGDCSGFAIACYETAGLPDPSGNNYNGQGFTGDLETHGDPIGSPQPGALAFWSRPDHCAVCVDDSGGIVEFGGPPAPVRSTVDDEHRFHASFVGFRSYAGAQTRQVTQTASIAAPTTPTQSPDSLAQQLSLGPFFRAWWFLFNSGTRRGHAAAGATQKYVTGYQFKTTRQGR